jgi:hypothetical protein
MGEVAFGVWVAAVGVGGQQLLGEPQFRERFQGIGGRELSLNFSLVTKASCPIAVPNTFIRISV